MAAGPSPSAWRSLAHTAKVLVERPDLRVTLVASLVLGLAVSFVTPFLSMFGTREVGLSLAGFAAFMLVTVTSNIWISTVLAHHSDTPHARRTMLLWGSCAGAVGYAGYAWMRNVWALLAVSSLLLGVASVTFSQLFAHARECVDRSAASREHAPLYMNAIRMFFALAWTVGPAIAAYTLRAFGFRGLFLAASSLYALLFALVFLFVRRDSSASYEAPSPDHTSRARDDAGAPHTHFPMLRPDVVRWFLALSLVLAAHTISMSNMSLFVLYNLQGNQEQVGTIFSLAPIFELPLMLYFGLLATRLPAARLMRVAVVLAFIYYALVSIVRAPQQIYPLQMLIAAVVSVTSGVAITFFQDKIPGKAGTATNLYTSASRLGSTSGYLIFGGIASTCGHRGAYVACAALSFLAWATTWTAQER